MTEKRRETERHRVNDNSLERDTETERDRDRGGLGRQRKRDGHTGGGSGVEGNREGPKETDTERDQDLYYCFVGFTWLYIHVLAESNPSKYGNKESSCQCLL